jgi:hypothetical protein
MSSTASIQGLNTLAAMTGMSGLSGGGSSENSSTLQILEEILSMLQQMLQQQGGDSSGAGGEGSGGAGGGGSPAAATGGGGGAASTSGAAPASGGASTTSGASSMNPQSASGALAGYMGTNGNSSINMNDLYQLSLGNAAGGKGQKPSPEVQQAAQYMLANPSVYNQIETHDVPGSDGIAGIGDLENAAQGNFPITAPSTGGTTSPSTGGTSGTTGGTTGGGTDYSTNPDNYNTADGSNNGILSTTPGSTSGTTSGATGGTTAGTTSTTSGASSMNPQNASGALAGYMGTNGNSALNVNDLYQLSLGNAAGGKGQKPSPEVQQAAQYMLGNPSVYNQIETHDVPGSDGIAGMADFQNAAQGNFAINTNSNSSTAA